jgi:hypothetical protein
VGIGPDAFSGIDECKSGHRIDLKELILNMNDLQDQLSETSATAKPSSTFMYLSFLAHLFSFEWAMR